VNSLKLGEIMFALDSTIDAIQTSQKTMVTTFITNKAIADAMISFVDTQTEYTKKAVKAGTETATTLAAESTKMIQEAAKMDYSKFGEGFVKAWTSATKK
jgi:hypothetical protein